ncbi:MAG: NUDIX domain-containing protein [Bdellovibrio sp.]
MTKNILSSGVIPVRHEERKWLFLILRSYNYWDFPKGVVELNEDSWSAALRELKEETGIEFAKPLFSKEFFETVPYSKGKIARYYLAEVTSEKVIFAPNPETGIYEHHEFKWLPYKEARRLLVPRVQEALDWAQAKLTSS